METIRIRLTTDQKENLKKIAERDHRSLTGVIRNWIDADRSQPEQANDLFSNKYIKDD